MVACRTGRRVVLTIDIKTTHDGLVGVPWRRRAPEDFLAKPLQGPVLANGAAGGSGAAGDAQRAGAELSNHAVDEIRSGGDRGRIEGIRVVDVEIGVTIECRPRVV